MCFGGVASPYENEEILYLATVAGLIRKEPFLINLFLPSHQHSAFVNARLSSDICRLPKFPTRNSLFDDIDQKMRQISLVADVSDPPINRNQPDAKTDVDAAGSSSSLFQSSADSPHIPKEFDCDCDVAEDRLAILDAILGYFDSSVSFTFILNI